MKLSICSSTSSDIEYLNLNLELTNLKDIDYEWIVVNNTFKDERTDHVEISREFNIVGGVPVTHYNEPCKSYSQMQHGLSLNRAILETRGNFLLLLDPDFYILQPLANILSYMDKNNIRIFGAPYMSETKLVTNFPVGFCMFIDLRHIKKESLDFTPGYGPYIDLSVYPDVGYKVYKEHLKLCTKFESVIPSVVDKKVPYNFTTKCLKTEYNIEYDDMLNSKGSKIDEYFFKDKIFGVHLRSKLFQKINFERDRINKHMDTIKMITNRIRINE